MATSLKLRASSLARLEACPASYWLAKHAPPQPESEAASSGTAIHAALAGETPARPLTPEEEDVADLCRETVAGMYETDSDEVITEWEIEHPLPCGTLTGHCDRVEIRGNRAVIVDYKTGRDPVPSAGKNVQLLAYALLVKAICSSPQMGPRLREIEEFDLAIVQPLAPGGGSRWVINLAELRDAYLRIRDVFIAVEQAEEDPTPNPSESACKYCPALAICPAHRKAIATVSVTDSAPARWQLATRDEKLALWGQMRAAKKAIAALEWLFRQDLEENPDAFGGAIYIGKGRTQREVVDAPGLFAAMQGLGVTGQEFVECCRVTIGGLERLVKARTGLKGKALAERFQALVAPYVETATTKGSLETA